MSDVKSNRGVYTRHFSDPLVVENYIKKFDGRIDRIRHAIEVRILSDWARGELFDCSIGSGRFIGELSSVTRYGGMDYSEPFLQYIRHKYPAVAVVRGDLSQGIAQKDNCFDTVMCLRTLFALNPVDKILAEMVRITRPGGRIIFDYGYGGRSVIVDGVSVSTSSREIESVLRSLPVREVARHRLDGLLTTFKRRRAMAFASELVARLPMGSTMLRWLEVLLARWSGERVLYILDKH